MSDLELRTKCLEYAIEIMNWYKSVQIRPKTSSHIDIAEQVFQYLKTGKP